MAAPNLSQIGQYLAGLFRRRRPEEELPPDPPERNTGEFIFGEPPRPLAPTPAQPKTFRSPEIDKLTGDYESMLQQLLQPAPKPVQPETNVGENIAATLLGLGTNNLAAKSRAFNTPYSLAAGRAQSANEQAMAAHEQQQKSLAQGLDVTQRMIGGFQDRDAAAEAVEGKLRVAEMRGQIQQFVANARNNTLLVSALGKYLGEGKGTVPGVAAILRQMNPGWDQAIAEEAADGVMKQIQQDPSFHAQIQQVKVQNEQDKLRVQQIGQTKQMLRDRKDLTSADIFHAYQDLRELGDPAYQNMDDKAMLELAEKLSISQQQGLADIDLKAAQTRWRDVYTKLLPTELALKTAVFRFDVEKFTKEYELALDKFDSDTAEKAAAAARDAAGKVLTNLQQQHGNLTTEINTLRDKKAQLELAKAKYPVGGVYKDADGNQYTTQELQQQIDAYTARIDAVKKKRDKISEEAAKTRGGLVKSGIEAPERGISKDVPAEWQPHGAGAQTARQLGLPQGAPATKKVRKKPATRTGRTFSFGQ